MQRYFGGVGDVVSLQHQNHAHLHTAKNLHCIIPKKDLHR